MAANDGFIMAVGPDGKKRRVPPHYLEAPFNFKLPPSKRAKEPATTTATTTVHEPAQPGNKKEASE